MLSAVAGPWAGARGVLEVGCAGNGWSARRVRLQVQVTRMDALGGMGGISVPTRGRAFLQQVDDRFNSVLRVGQRSAESLLRRDMSSVDPAGEDEISELMQDDRVDSTAVLQRVGLSDDGERRGGVFGGNAFVQRQDAYQGPTDGWGTYDLELRGETGGFGSTLAAENPPRRLLLRMSTAQQGGAQLWRRAARNRSPGVITDAPIPFLLYDVTEANLARVFGVRDAWLRDNQGLAYFPDNSGNFHLEEDAARTEDNWMVIGSGPWEVRGTPIGMKVSDGDAGERYEYTSSVPFVGGQMRVKPNTSLVLWVGALSVAFYVYNLWMRAKDERSVARADAELASALGDEEP